MFHLILQLHGGKGSSTTTQVQAYTPSDEEKQLMQLEVDAAKAYAPNISYLNDTALSLLKDTIGTTQYDFNAANQAAQSQIASANNSINSLANGELPQAYLDNMQQTINSQVENSLGSALSSLGSKGIVNSSVMNRGIQGISDSAANAMANAYNTNLTTASQLASQQASQATAGMTAAAAAQEAAQAPALALWNASMGLNQSNNSTLSALAGSGTKTTTGTTTTNSGVLSGLSGLLSGVSFNFCFADDTKVKTPSGEKLIRHIRQGDVITCPNEDGTENDEVVIETLKPRDENVYTVVCGTKFVNTTLTQPLLDSEGNWVIVKDLHLGSNLTVGEVSGILYSGVRKVYDLKVTGDNRYYANGFIAKGAEEEW